MLRTAGGRAGGRHRRAPRTSILKGRLPPRARRISRPKGRSTRRIRGEGACGRRPVPEPEIAGSATAHRRPPNRDSAPAKTGSPPERSPQSLRGRLDSTSRPSQRSLPSPGMGSAIGRLSNVPRRNNWLPSFASADTRLRARIPRHGPVLYAYAWPGADRDRAAKSPPGSPRTASAGRGTESVIG